MPNRVQWFNILEGKKPTNLLDERRRMITNPNILAKSLGGYLLDFPNSDEWDVVPNQIRNIEERTISAYPVSIPDETKWNDEKAQKFSKDIQTALDSILNMTVKDAVKLYIGNHKLPISGKPLFLDLLYLDDDDRSWKVGEIASDISEFDQSLFRYGKEDLTAKQQKLVKGLIPLEKKDLESVVKNLEVRITKSKSILEERAKQTSLDFTISFGFDTNSSIHKKRVEDIFKGQKVQYVDDSKTEKSVEKPKFEIETSVPSGDLEVIEDDPAVEGTGGRIKESEVSRLGIKTKPKELPKTDEFKEREKEYAESEAAQEMIREWNKRHIFNERIEDIIDDPTKEDIKKWFLKLWNSKNNNLWDFLKGTLPLSVTSVGNYELLFKIREDETGNITSEVSWVYNQKRELVKELLTTVAGESSVQRYNMGEGFTGETTRMVSARGDKIKGRGYNSYRNYLATHVSNRLKQLNSAISRIQGSD
mgnify:FL=1